MHNYLVWLYTHMIDTCPHTAWMSILAQHAWYKVSINIHNSHIKTHAHMFTIIFAQIYTAQEGQKTTHLHTCWNTRYFFNAPSDLHKDDALPPRDKVLFSDLRYTLLLVSSLANAFQRLWGSHFSDAWHVVDDPGCGKGDTGSCTCHWATLPHAMLQSVP